MDQNNLKARLWQGALVHKNFSVIKSVLGSNNLFYDSEVNVDQEGIPNALSFADIPKDRRGEVLERFTREVEFIEQKILALKADQDNFTSQKNARLLEQSASYIDKSDVFLLGNKLKLKRWGYDILDSKGKKSSKRLSSLITELNEIHNRPEFTEELKGDLDWKKVIQGVLAFLLFSLIAFLCFKYFPGCDSTESGNHTEISEKEKQQQSSYAESRVYLMPIDSGQVIAKPDDSLQLINIISTQLNVFLNEGDNLDSIAHVLERDYEEVTVKGRDPNYQQIILETVPEKRSAVKNAIQKQFPNFLVVDESVFRNEAKTYDDPFLSDNNHSWYLDVIGAKEMWKSNQGSQDIVIAVIDDAFDISHPELKNKIVKPWNVWKNSDQLSAGYEWLNHGTHVASCAAAELNNGHGLAGVAPGCSIMPIQVGDEFGNMSLSALLKGIMYAYLNGADVINLSIGSLQLSNGNKIPDGRQKEISKNKYLEEEKVWKRIFKRSVDYNCIIVQAAGNSSCLASIDPMKRDTVNSIIVAASDRGAKLSTFSSYGEMCKIVAPGSEIYNAVPGNKYESMNGTSMASPLVAGAVALVKSQNDSLSLKEILEELTRNSKSLDPRVGPVVNLGSLKVDNNPSKTIQDLKNRIKELKRKLKIGLLTIPSSTAAADYMDGIWVSRGNIVNPVTGESMEMVYSIGSEMAGITTLRLDENKYKCEGTVDVSLESNSLRFQHSDFICDNTKNQIGYEIICKNNSTGLTQCFFSINGKLQSLPFQMQKI